MRWNGISSSGSSIASSSSSPSPPSLSSYAPPVPVPDGGCGVPGFCGVPPLAGCCCCFCGVPSLLEGGVRLAGGFFRAPASAMRPYSEKSARCCRLSSCRVNVVVDSRVRVDDDWVRG